MSQLRIRNDDRGSVSAFVVILVPALLLCAGLVLDGGQALAGKARAMGEAAEAARAGAAALDVPLYRSTGRPVLDRHRAELAVQTYLSTTGDTYRVTVTDQDVTVSVTHHQPTQLMSLVGITALTVTGTATAHPVTSTARTP